MVAEWSTSRNAAKKEKSKELKNCSLDVTSCSYSPNTVPDGHIAVNLFRPLPKSYLFDDVGNGHMISNVNPLSQLLVSPYSALFLFLSTFSLCNRLDVLLTVHFLPLNFKEQAIDTK